MIAAPVIPWLIASTAAAIMPLQAHVSLWAWLLAIGMLLWRTGELTGRLPTLRPWQHLTLALLATAGVLATYRSLLGQSAGSSLIVVLATLKLAESANQRDATLLLYLNLFLCFVRFIFTQQFPEALLLLPQLLVTLAALHTLHGTPHAHWQARLRQSGRLLGQAIPLALLLFVLFPRLDGPLWRLPNDAHHARTGLSDSMSPGNIASLSQSTEVAFRVQFHGTTPARSNLYWRGPVLSHFDGRSWLPTHRREPSVLPAAGKAPICYTVIQEPHHKHWIFALEALAELPVESRLNGEYQLQSIRPQHDLKRYTLTSWQRYRLPDDPASLQEALQLPPDTNPEALALARQWRASSRTASDVVNQALQHFHLQPFHYTLRPPLLGEQPIDDFLFRSQRGFCEHYASSFVWLMRAAGIPARVVTGYQGGEPNPAGGYWIIRQSDAHAWAEVWLGDQGWQRVDPTAAVAPNRIEQGLATALPETEPLPLIIRNHSAWLRGLRLGWDAAIHRWNQQLLGYDSQRQLTLLKSLGIPDLAPWQTAALLTGCIALPLLPALLWQAWQRQRQVDPLAAAWLRYCRTLARHGLARPPAQTATEFASQAIHRWPLHAPSIREITQLYLQLRYYPHPDPAKLARLRKLISTFNPSDLSK